MEVAGQRNRLLCLIFIPKVVLALAFLVFVHAALVLIILLGMSLKIPGVVDSYPNLLTVNHVYTCLRSQCFHKACKSKRRAGTTSVQKQEKAGSTL